MQIFFALNSDDYSSKRNYTILQYRLYFFFADSFI